MNADEYFTPARIEQLAAMSLRHSSPPPADPLKLELWAIDLFNRERSLLEEALEALDDN